jgi:hypothetical protein
MTVTKALIDGGAELNIIFSDTLRKMGLELAGMITPNKFLLSSLSYLFSPIVLGLDHCLHGLEIVRELLFALLESWQYQKQKIQVRKLIGKERRKKA